MEFMTMFFIIAGFCGLILQYWKNEAPFSLLTELFGIGGIVTTIQEYTGGTMEETPALVIIIAMVGVMIWSSWNLVLIFMPNKIKRR